MLKDGIFLIGDNNKDAIMKLDYTGKILFRKDAGNTDIVLIKSASLQFINDKMIIILFGTESNAGGPFEMYFVMNSDGSFDDRYVI